MKKKWRNFIRKSRAEYNKIQSRPCPVFGTNNIVFFNRHGFNHIIFKDRRYRLHSEQFRRIKLLPYAIEVLKKANSIYKYEKRVGYDSTAEFWTLKETIELQQVRKTVIVIVRKTNNSQLHFFSVFDE